MLVPDSAVLVLSEDVGELSWQGAQADSRDSLQ